MASPPIPGRKPAALTLGAGVKRTAWPDLDPAARLNLLNEVLAMHPDWTVSGGVDHESALEPLLFDGAGNLIALDGSRAGTALAVDVFPGALDERMKLAVLAAGALAFVLLIDR